MPKVIKLDGMKPGEYGLAFKDAMQSALKNIALIWQGWTIIAVVRCRIGTYKE